MIISDEQAAARLNSPMNLVNRMNSRNARQTAMKLFGVDVRSRIAEREKQAELAAEIAEEEKKNGYVKHSFNPFARQEANAASALTNRDSVQLESQSPQSNALVPSSPRSIQNEQPNLDDLLDNNEQQIQLAHAHDRALAVLNSSLGALKSKIDDIKPDKLPSVVVAVSKTIDNIRKERLQATRAERSGDSVHLHVYMPEQHKIEQYDVIDV